MDAVVSFVLHSKEPVALVDKVVFPQLLVTVTTGAAGTAVTVAVACCEVAEQPALFVIVTV
jgi:hypothetical protein